MAIIACDIMNKYIHMYCMYICYRVDQHPCIMLPFMVIKR